MNTPIAPKGIDTSRSIWLPKNVPSSKNNREIGYYFLNPADNSNWFIKIGEQFRKIRPTLRSSDRTEAYVKHIAPFLIENRRKFQELIKDLPKPYFIELHFVRDSRHKYDFINACQILADCFTGSYWKNDKQIPLNGIRWLEDDDCDNVYFLPPCSQPHYSLDKANPGVWLTVVDKRVKSQPNEEVNATVRYFTQAEIQFKSETPEFCHRCLHELNECFCTDLDYVNL